MHLNCPSCRFPIESNDVNLVKTIAKCKSCNNIFEFGENLRGKELPARYRKEVVIPPGVEVLHLMNELEIMVKWRQSSKKFTLFFALFWNAIIFFVSSFMFLAGEVAPILFMIPFILVGVYLLYESIGYLVNTTFITVDENRLSLDHRPLKFLTQKDRHFHPDNIEQIFVRRYEVGKANDQPVYAFEVMLKLKKEKEQSLVKALHSVEHARYIEQEIEYYLKIKDRPVHGEWDTGL